MGLALEVEEAAWPVLSSLSPSSEQINDGVLENWYLKVSYFLLVDKSDAYEET